MSLDRRSLLLGAGALSSQLLIKHAEAAPRAPYGGTFRAHVPISLRSIDPHDPTNLAGGLLGSALFETLYAQTSSGRLYPTLAEGMPEFRKGRVFVTLRPGMKLSDGQPLSGRVVAASLIRSQKLSPALSALGRPGSSTGSLELSFPKRSTEEVARLLSGPRSAIVSRDFSPATPVGCGAMHVLQTGSIVRMERNRWAPRGGSYLEQAVFQTAPVVDCLRAFESKRSDLGFLGAGLHHLRKGVPRFQWNDFGIAVVRPGREFNVPSSIGFIHEALARVPSGPLAALGVDRNRRPARKWTEADTTLLVSRDEPWMISIARELATAWTDRNHQVRVIEASRSELNERLRTRRYGLYLQAISTTGLTSETITETLFKVDGTSAPRGGRILSPQEAGRQLRLGVVGTLNPHGALSPNFWGLSSSAGLTLPDAQRKRPR